jgi:hypothetical protein
MEIAILFALAYLGLLALLLAVGAFFWLINKAFDLWDRRAFW